MSYATTTITLKQFDFAAAGSPRAPSSAQPAVLQGTPAVERLTAALTEVASHFTGMIAVGARATGGYLFALLLVFWHVAFIASLL